MAQGGRGRDLRQFRPRPPAARLDRQSGRIRAGALPARLSGDRPRPVERFYPFCGFPDDRPPPKGFGARFLQPVSFVWAEGQQPPRRAVTKGWRKPSAPAAAIRSAACAGRSRRERANGTARRIGGCRSRRCEGRGAWSPSPCGEGLGRGLRSVSNPSRLPATLPTRGGLGVPRRLTSHMQSPYHKGEIRGSMPRRFRPAGCLKSDL